MKFKVTKKSPRSYGLPDRCYYCNALIGENHADNCVCISKKMKIKTVVEYESVMTVPSYWSKDDCEDFLNEKMCGDMVIEELTKITEKNVFSEVLKIYDDIFLDEEN